MLLTMNKVVGMYLIQVLMDQMVVQLNLHHPSVVLFWEEPVPLKVLRVLLMLLLLQDQQVQFLLLNLLVMIQPVQLFLLLYLLVMIHTIIELG